MRNILIFILTCVFFSCNLWKDVSKETENSSTEDNTETTVSQSTNSYTEENIDTNVAVQPDSLKTQLSAVPYDRDTVFIHTVETPKYDATYMFDMAKKLFEANVKPKPQQVPVTMNRKTVTNQQTNVTEKKGVNTKTKTKAVVKESTINWDKAILTIAIVIGVVIIIIFLIKKFL